jgi:hypothetical protein
MYTGNLSTEYTPRNKPKVLVVDKNPIKSSEREETPNKICYELLNTFEDRPHHKSQWPKARYWTNTLDIITPYISTIKTIGEKNNLKLLLGLHKRPSNIDSVKNDDLFKRDFIPFISEERSTMISPIGSPKSITCEKCLRFDEFDLSSEYDSSTCSLCQLRSHFSSTNINESNRIPKNKIEKSKCLFCGKRGHLICKTRNLIIEDDYSSDDNLYKKPSNIF